MESHSAKRAELDLLHLEEMVALVFDWGFVQVVGYLAGCPALVPLVPVLVPALLAAPLEPSLLLTVPGLLSP
jgi:hypothetical protein